MPHPLNDVDKRCTRKPTNNLIVEAYSNYKHFFFNTWYSASGIAYMYLYNMFYIRISAV